MTSAEIAAKLRKRSEALKDEATRCLRAAETLERRQYQFDMLVKLTTAELPLDRIQITMKDGDKEVSFSLHCRDFPTLERDIQSLCCGYRKESQQIIEKTAHDSKAIG